MGLIKEAVKELDKMIIDECRGYWRSVLDLDRLILKDVESFGNCMVNGLIKKHKAGVPETAGALARLMAMDDLVIVKVYKKKDYQKKHSEAQ